MRGGCNISNSVYWTHWIPVCNFSNEIYSWALHLQWVLYICFVNSATANLRWAYNVVRIYNTENMSISVNIRRSTTYFMSGRLEMKAVASFTERMLFLFLQPPAALCHVRMESNLNIKTSSWSVSSPLASNSRHMTSISFPKAITNTKGPYSSKLASHLSAYVIVLLLSMYLCVRVAIAFSNVKCLIRLHKSWNGFLSALCVHGRLSLCWVWKHVHPLFRGIGKWTCPGKSSYCIFLLKVQPMRHTF